MGIRILVYGAREDIKLGRREIYTSLLHAIFGRGEKFLGDVTGLVKTVPRKL